VTARDLVLPLADGNEVARYVVIDDEPRYRLPIEPGYRADLLLVGGYGTVDDFLDIQRQPCHVVVLDLCLNRQTGDAAVLQGVQAIRQLTNEHGHRVLVHTADARPEPVARCVAAGAAGYVSKYIDPGMLAAAIAEVGRSGHVITEALNDSLHDLLRRSRDVRLSSTLEATLALLDRGLPDAEIAGSDSSRCEPSRITSARSSTSCASNRRQRNAGTASYAPSSAWDQATSSTIPQVIARRAARSSELSRGCSRRGKTTESATSESTGISRLTTSISTETLKRQ
jgi:DNA-binding NarL/FixJ family response regulator